MSLRPAPLASAALLLFAVAACIVPALSNCSGPKSCYDTTNCITTVKQTVILQPNACSEVIMFGRGRKTPYGEQEPANVCSGQLVPTGVTAMKACEPGLLEDELICKNEIGHTGFPGVIIKRNSIGSSCPPTRGTAEVEICCKFPE